MYQNNSPLLHGITHFATLFQLGWVLHPIYGATGDYPPVMKEWMAKKSKEEGYSRSRLPSFTKEEIEMVRGEFGYTSIFGYSKLIGFFMRKVILNLRSG